MSHVSGIVTEAKVNNGFLSVTVDNSKYTTKSDYIKGALPQVGDSVEFDYTTSQKGEYVNQYLTAKTLVVRSAGGAPAPTSQQVVQAQAPAQQAVAQAKYNVTVKDRIIVEQNQTMAVVEIVKVAAENGGLTKAMMKDAETMLAYVRSLVRKSTDDLLKGGDGSFPEMPKLEVKEEDKPFDDANPLES